MDEGVVLLLVGLILAASLVVALVASRKGVPSLVAFLALGMLLGSDGPGGIEFDDADLARSVGIVGLVAILYEGGLSTSWRRLREVAVPAALLSTVGVVVTAALTGLVAQAVFDLSWLRGDPARRRRGLHRRRGGLRHAALHEHPPAARPHARGRDGRQRPDGDRPDGRADRLDRALGLRLPGPRARGRARARARARRRCRARRRRDVAVRAHSAVHRGLRPGRVGRRGGALVRSRGRARRERVPGRLPGRPRRREHAVALSPAAGRRSTRGWRSSRR